MSAAISPPGGTLDHGYNFNGPGAGRTILANNGPVEITGTGSTACLRLDGVGMAHIEFQGLVADPAVSAAGDAKLIYNSTTNTFRASYNGAAYVNLGSGGGGSLQDAYDFVVAGTGTSGDILLTSGQGPIRITNPDGILTGTVTVTNGLAAVVGVGTLFLTEVYPNQNIIFASDLTYTTYQVLSVTDNLNMTLTAVYAGTTTAGDTATVLQEALTAANQTNNQTVASFSGRIGGGPGGIMVGNSFTRTAPLNANTAAICYQAGISDYDTPLTGTVDVTNGLAAVIGVGTLFLTQVFAGDSIEFASDPGTIYTVLSVTDNLNLTLSAPYTGLTTLGTAATAGDPASAGIIGYIVNTDKTRTGNLVGFATIGGNGAPSLWGLAVGSNLVLSALTFTPGSNEGNISLVAANGFGAGDAGRGVSFAGGAKGDSTALDGTITASNFSTSTWTQNPQTTGSPTLLTLVGGAHTTLAASTEASDVNVNLARTVEFATGALATQRAVRFQAPTYAFVAASTITTAATVAIEGAPTAGANATITNAYALDVTGDTRITGKLTVTGLIDPSGLYLDEQGADQPAVANKGVLYTKDVATVTELFYRASDGTVTQLTPGGGGGGSLQDAYDFTPSGAITLSLAGGPLAITNPAATAQTAFTVTQGTAGQLAALFTSGSISAPDTGGGSERFGASAAAAGTSATAIGNASTASGSESIAVGRFSLASAAETVALGYSSTASAIGAIAVGVSSSAGFSASIAIGQSALTGAADAIAIGGGSATASGAQSTSIGNASDATGLRAVALGSGSQSTATDSIAIGSGTANANNTIAMGNSATASNSGALAIGQSATASGSSSVALGNAASATATGALALGASSSASFAPSVAIGPSAATTATNQVVIGASSNPLTTIVFGRGVTDATPNSFVTLQATSGTGGGSAGGGLRLATGVSGDAATGSSALRLAVAVAGTGTALTDVLYVDSVEGSVLIGTATPVAGKKLVVSGDVKITGVLDPTALELATGTNLYIDSTDGSTAATAAVGHGRMVYNDTQKAWRASVDGGAYSNVVTAGSSSSLTSITLGLGTSGSPSLNFSGDLDTGVFSSGADTVNLSTGGTSRLALTTTALTVTLPYVGPLGASATPTFTFNGDLNTGMLSPGADQVALSTGGTSRFTLSTTVMTTTLPLRGQDGTATAPSLSYSGDTNTGVYRVTTDTLGFSTAGVSRLQINASGALLLMGSTSGSVGFVPPAVAGSTTYTLPSADGTNGQMLTTNGTATLSWTSPVGGSLDQAYDFGGPGAGRIITADSGDVVIVPTTTGGLSVPGIGGGTACEQFGALSSAGSPNSVALGYNAACTGASGGAMAVGWGATATASGGFPTAVGATAVATGGNTLAVGGGAEARAANCTAIGAGAIAGTTGVVDVDAVAVGRSATATKVGSIAIGGGTPQALHDCAIVLGFGGLSTAAHQMSVGSDSGYIDTVYLGTGATSAGPVDVLMCPTPKSLTGGAAVFTVRGGPGAGNGGNLVLGGGIGGTGDGDVLLQINTTTYARLNATGSFVLAANGALSTSATDGFTYLPTAAGRPTGTPTSVTGASALVYDTAASRLFVYNGAWINVAQTPVVAKTADYTIQASESPALFTNEGAGAQVILTLPTASAGLTVEVFVQAAQNLRVKATGSETVRIAGTVSGAAGYAEAATVGNALILKAINTTEWVAISSVGTWTVV